MTEALTFADYEADQAKHAALRNVQHNTEPTFLEQATAIVHEHASRQHTLTAEDVTTAVLEAGLEFHEKRAVANAILRASRNGWIEATSDHVRCTRPSRNGGWQRVWLSRLVSA